MKINSLQNPIVKHLATLRKEKRYRSEHKTALVSGKKVVEELFLKGAKFKTLLVEDGYKDAARFKADQVFYVTEEIMKKITGLLAPEEIAAEIELPERESLEGKKFLLVLDGIADPGNMGTLLRTALALGWEGVFITEDSVDPFNDKALRAGRGAAFSLPIRVGSAAELASLAKSYSVYVADKNGKELKDVFFEPKKPIMLILGNEAHGPREHGSREHPFAKISIPMKAEMESLNVATAGAILMYELSHE